MTLFPSGFIYDEYYLYSDKQYEVVPSGVENYALASGLKQNAPVVVTSSGYEETLSTDPWAKIDGSGKLDKKAYGHFTVNSAGEYDTSNIEFTTSPSVNGKLEFNQTLSQNLFVEYEACPSGYHYTEDINVNPMMRETDSGFLQITSIGNPEYLSLKSTQSILKGDGFRDAKIIATLYDQNLNRTYNQKIIFEMIFNLDPVSGPYEDIGHLIPGKINGGTYKIHASGFVSETYAYTDRFGQACAEFKTTPSIEGYAVFKAYYAEASGIYDTTDISCYKSSSKPFVLDSSLLDSLHYLSDAAWTASGIPGPEPE